MEDLRKEIAACCKQLRLSSNLADRAILQKGESNQEYLKNLLEDEIEYRKQTRIDRLIGGAGFPRRYST